MYRQPFSQYLIIFVSARAIESQSYVLAAAQYGKHNEKRESFGHSLAVDPWGKILADAGGYPLDDDVEENAPVKDAPSIVTCEIDLDLVDSIRQRMPIDLHRSSTTVSFQSYEMKIGRIGKTKRK
jgi:predicted amidohydrolase